jgi:membrane protease YdiL (CAAX protease family)
VEPAGITFLLVTGVLYPALALLSHRRLSTGVEQLPPRTPLFVQTILIQLVSGALAVLAADAQEVPLVRAHTPGVRGVLAGLAVLAVALGTLRWRWHHRSAEPRRRLLAIVPQRPSEYALWLLVCVAAAVCEEIVYRGVMPALLGGLTGSAWVAVATSAVVFALSHLVQGWRSAGVVLVFALAFHWLVWLTGGLYVAMAVHFAYDLAAGILLGTWGRPEEEPALGRVPAEGGRVLSAIGSQPRAES